MVWLCTGTAAQEEVQQEERAASLLVSLGAAILFSPTGHALN